MNDEEAKRWEALWEALRVIKKVVAAIAARERVVTEEKEGDKRRHVLTLLAREAAEDADEELHRRIKEAQIKFDAIAEEIKKENGIKRLERRYKHV